MSAVIEIGGSVIRGLPGYRQEYREGCTSAFYTFNFNFAIELLNDFIAG